jgi:hypothetical protein
VKVGEGTACGRLCVGWDFPWLVVAEKRHWQLLKKRRDETSVKVWVGATPIRGHLENVIELLSDCCCNDARDTRVGS